MRICLISREFVPFWGAGIGTYASQMAAAWAGAGHEIHILSLAHAGLTRRGPELRPGVQFHTIDLSAGVARWDAYRFAFLRHSMAVYLRLLELHGREPFDYIEFPEYWGEGYFALRGRQTLGQFASAVIGLRLHTPTQECRELNRDAWLDEEIAYLEHAEDESMRLADVLISPSRSLLDKIRARLDLVDKPAHVVPYPFDVQSALDELGVKEVEAPRPASPNSEILYFGRIEHRKGVHILVDAAQRLLEEGIDLHFRFVGRDSPAVGSGEGGLAWVQRRIHPRWQDRFHFEAARPREELGALIRASTACCFPSIWENFPNACLEAMALGAPVIGSDAGGMAEIIENERSGLLFRSGDAGDLSRTLRRVVTEHDLRQRIRAGAPARIADLCGPSRIVRAMTDTVASVSPPSPPAPMRSEASSPRVSIIIPHYNLARYLPETIESARAQTFTDHEIIIIDDGSTDRESIDLVDRLEAGEFGDLRIVRKQNGGLASARNAGIAAARGRWIVPLDADDLLAPAFLERTLAAAARDPGAAFITSLVCHFAEAWGDFAAGWVPLGLERDILAYTNCASCCTALIDRESLLKVGGYEAWLNLYEDWDLYCRFAALTLRGLVIPEFLIGYRHRPTSMLRSQDAKGQARTRAFMYARHAGLSDRPDRTMRLQLSETGLGAEARARQMITENIRYQLADRLNDLLKKVRMQGRLKRLAHKVGRDNRAG